MSTLAGRFRGPLGFLLKFKDTRARRRSWEAPVLQGGRDGVRYFKNGRSAFVCAELVSPGRTVYQDQLKRWDDGNLIEEPERREILSAVCEWYSRRGEAWRLA